MCGPRTSTQKRVCPFAIKRLETHGVYDRDSKLLDCVVQVKITSKFSYSEILNHMEFM